jgi:hypothetical protein
LMSSLWSLNTIPTNGATNPTGTTQWLHFVSKFVYLWSEVVLKVYVNQCCV